MGKLRLSVHRKNEVRKKYGCLYRIRIPRQVVSVMNVSIPLDLIPLKVSLPLSFFSATMVSSLSTLRMRTLDLKFLPQGIIFCVLASRFDSVLTV